MGVVAAAVLAPVPLLAPAEKTARSLGPIEKVANAILTVQVRLSGLKGLQLGRTIGAIA